jgi:glucans biosynthesis protein C
MDNKGQPRNNYLDWLRVLGILLVFIYHTTRPHTLDDWVVKNAIQYTSIQAWNDFVVLFMMPLMFAISGASLFYALGKGGFGRFLKDKMLRLLVPLLVTDLTASALQAYQAAASHSQFTGSFFQYLPTYYHLNTIHWLGDHLYYLLVLFIFSVLLYPPLRWLKTGSSNLLSKLGKMFSKPGVVYILALPILWVFGLIPSSSLLMQTNGDWPYITYLGFTLLGFLVVSDVRLQDRIRQMRWISLVGGLALGVSYLILKSSGVDKIHAITPALVLEGATQVFGGWMCVLAIFGQSMQDLTCRSPRLEYANEAVLPFYILHQTVIVSVAFVALRSALPDVVEWAVIAGISMAITLSIYEILVRRWNGMRFLFGMKRLPPRLAEETIQSQPGGPVRAE